LEFKAQRRKSFLVDFFHRLTRLGKLSDEKQPPGRQDRQVGFKAFGFSFSLAVFSLSFSWLSWRLGGCFALTFHVVA
jgi:hypothetical protein